MAEPPPFFLVWREGGGSPTFKHERQDGAAGEAERLARAHPGERFFVLAPLQAIERSDVIRTRYHLDELPF